MKYRRNDKSRTIQERESRNVAERSRKIVAATGNPSRHRNVLMTWDENDSSGDDESSWITRRIVAYLIAISQFTWTRGKEEGEVRVKIFFLEFYIGS